MKARAASRSEINAVLTPEQRIKHARLHKQRMEKRKQRHENRRGDRERTWRSGW